MNIEGNRKHEQWRAAWGTRDMSGVSPEPTLQPDRLTEMRFTPLVEEGTRNAQAWKTFCSGILPRTNCVSQCVSTGYVIVHLSINSPVFLIYSWDSNVWLVFGSQYLRHNSGSKSNPGTSEKPEGAGLVGGLSVYVFNWLVHSFKIWILCTLSSCAKSQR